MRKIKILSLFIVLTVAISSIFFACKKDSNGDANSDVLYVSAGADLDVTAYANLLFYQVHEQIVDVAELKSATSNDCQYLSAPMADTIAGFSRYYIGYVDSCIKFNRLIKGSIEFSAKNSNYWVGTGLRNVINFNMVNVNGLYGMGVMTISYEGKNTLGQPVFTQKIDSCLLFYNDSTGVQFSCNRTLTWTAGYDNASRINDKFEITGTAKGLDINQNEFVDTIAVPLVLSNPIVCKWIKSGKMKIFNKDIDGTVTFSTCDSLASFDTKSAGKKIPQPF